jgi:hypothetical protein
MTHDPGFIASSFDPVRPGDRIAHPRRVETLPPPEREVHPVDDRLRDARTRCQDGREVL